MNRCPYTGKASYVTQAKAHVVRIQLERRRNDRYEDRFVHGPLSVFRCKCGDYHIGHSTLPAPKKSGHEAAHRYQNRRGVNVASRSAA